MKTIFSMAAPLAFAALITLPVSAQEGKELALEKPIPLTKVLGTLVDAGCRNRTAINLGLAPETFAAAAPTQTAGEIQNGSQMRSAQGYANPAAAQAPPQSSAFGVTVDSKTLAAERPDILQHQVQDLRSRQLDPTCAITGATHSFALLTSTGRLLNLDDGGNTYATEAVQGSAQGREMLSGNGGGFKPVATVTGRLKADHLVTQSIKFNK